MKKIIFWNTEHLSPGGVMINVSRGAAAGQAVRFCFWHAPSGNNGTIVAQMANGLDAGGHPFVLFGDLNAEPLAA